MAGAVRTHIKSIHSQWDWQTLPPLADWVIEEAVRIQQIAAPTFHEAQRAGYIRQCFADFDLCDVSIDAVSNVYGRLPGKNSARAILISAHTDTVFAADADLRIKRADKRIYGPGLGDNSLGVAAALGLIKTLRERAVQPACDIWFVANSCEEGLGDLRGIKAAFDRLQSQISAVINLEGLAFGHIYIGGIAVHRLHITARAAGGHSWLHYGRPSAIHSLMELGTAILKLDIPKQPRTTCNIGMLQGGHAINAIATEASLWLDLRSTSPAALKRLRGQVDALVRQQEQKGLRYEIAVVGDRPAGAIAEGHLLVQGALAALSQVGISGAFEVGSTDGNLPLSRGCPTVTIGITRGGNAHRLDEFIDLPPVRGGMQQLITLALATAAHYARA